MSKDSESGTFEVALPRGVTPAPTRPVPNDQARDFGLAVCARLGLDPALVSDRFDWEVDGGAALGKVHFTVLLPADEILAHVQRSRAGREAVTTQTLTLTDFLLARIAEDETVARAVPEVETKSGAAIFTSLQWPTGTVEMSPDRGVAECEAKRRIVELHKPVTDPAWPGQVFCDELETGADSAYPCPTIRILAAVYADHPDYREQEWKP